MTTSLDTALTTYQIDAAHSEATFSVRHLITKVRGRFSEFAGTIAFDRSNPEQSKVTFTIQAASIDTNQKDRDAHLRTSDFFLVDEYPTATFRSTSFSGTPEEFEVTGDLTLRGVTKQVVLTGEFGGIVTDGYGQTKAGATARTKINRQDFGVSWNAALEAGGVLVSNDVKISIELQAVRAA